MGIEMHGPGLESEHRRERLEELYGRYTRREFVHPDPLEFLYRYPRLEDREIVGLIASSLAYGRVRQILASVEKVLAAMGQPAPFVCQGSHREWSKTFSAFKHRFSTGQEMVRLLVGIKNVLREYGSLEACFLDGMTRNDDTVFAAALAFSRKLTAAGGGPAGSLLPRPEGKSACKRLNLYLRWMVRRDAVDPGGWDRVPASKLVVPLDTHMHRMARAMGLTRRKPADGRTALEITEAFRRFAPHDAVRYDFALTRLGIRKIPDFEFSLLGWK